MPTDTNNFEDLPGATAVDYVTPGENPLTITHPLLREIDALIARYFVLTPEQRLVIALWVIHTYVADKAAQTPYLAVTSPEKRCGKTFLLELLAMLALRGWYIVGPSEPVVFRTVDALRPTLILDEYDTIFGPKTAQYHEGLRQMLNAGNRPGAQVPRCVGASMTPANFSVYCPKALGGIGHLPDTIADRSLIITMKRKLPSEKVERFRKSHVQARVDEVKPKIETWVAELKEALTDAEPDLPDELNDRMQDACEALIAIADLMGDGEIAREAIVEIAGNEPETHESTRLKLLRDLRTVWSNGWQPVNMPTKFILPALHALDPSWNNYYDRGPLKDTDLASLLSYFGCSPKTVWIPKGALVNADGSPYPGHDEKGYKYDELADAWERYLNAEEVL